MMMKRRLATLLSLLTLILVPSGVLAQNALPLGREIPLSRVVYELYKAEIDENIELLTRSSPGRLDELVSAGESDLNDALLIAQALSTQLSTFPLGSSAGGFAWTFDPGVGAFTRTSASFGPIFAERALTVGRDKLNFGINYQRTTFDEFEELDLRDRDVRFFTSWDSTRLGEDALRLSVSTDTVGLFVNYGLTDRLDVGIALPLIRVKLDADLRFVFRVRGGQGEQSGTFEQTRSGGRSKTGFGDVVARTKYNVLQQPGGGVALGFDLRLPTGDEDNLLGIPGTQAKIYGIYSAALGKFSPHVNVGYTLSRGNAAVEDPTSVFLEPPDEFNYTGGVDISLTPRLTFAGDIVGRTLRDMNRLQFIDVGFGPSFQEFALRPETESLRLVLTSLGVKYNVFGNFLISGNVLFPLTKAGLRDRFTPVLGLDYSF